ncbi:MAG: hypothetical protein VKQ33_09775 [Candidatus Sericytochromatia bacterium]|nr:hypothetical protein [Candidatus Sericytochromatia bacterium]
MARQLTPAEVEAWKAIARNYHKLQTQLSEQRERIQRLLTDTEAVLPAYAEDSLAARHLRQQRRMLKLSLANLSVYPLDSSVYQPPTGVRSPGYEANALEIKFLTLELELTGHQALRALVAGTLSPGEGEAAAAHPAWAAQAEAIAASAERRAAWERFVRDVEALEEGMRGARTALEAIARGMAEPERLAVLQGVKVPVLAGLAYRVKTALKLIPGGGDVAAALRAELVPPPPAGKVRGRGRTTGRLKSPSRPQP